MTAAASAPRSPKLLYRVALQLLAPLVCCGVLLHVFIGLLSALLLFPPLPQAARNQIIQIWSRVLLRIVGVRLQVHGAPRPDSIASFDPRPSAAGCLILSNHVSWLDIFAIDAFEPVRFIAKADITRWPLLGWLVTLVGTLYVERGRRQAVARINQSVSEHLGRGETVAIFPEGTTTDGSSLLPFHSNLLQPALDAKAEIRPVAIRYTQDGRFAPAAAYVGDMSLVASLWRVVTAPHLTAELHWLPPLPTAADRHTVSRAARSAIAGALGIADDGATTTSAPLRTAPEQSGVPARSSQ